MSRPQKRAAGARVAARGHRANTAVEAGLVVTLVWAASRVLVVVTLLWALLRGRPINEALTGWDAAIYTRLAIEGYTKDTDAAFFPGLPLVLRGFAQLGLNPPVVGMVLAIVCSGFAAWALFRLGSQWRPGKAQPVLGGLAASLWLLAPTTVFATVAYTEAPFCAAAFWAWERARAKHWPAAALLTAVACSLRVSGVFLLVALLVMAAVGDRSWRRGRHGLDDRDPQQRGRAVAWMCAPVLVLLVHAWWLQQATGSWTAWIDAQQSGWARGFTHPWQALKHTWAAIDPKMWPGRPRVGWVFLAEIISMALGVVTTLACLVQRRWAETVWVALQVAALGTSYWYMSVNRALLLWFPLFLLAAGLLVDQLPRPTSAAKRATRRRGVATVAVVALVCSVLAAGWAWLYFSGQWAS